MFKAWQQADIDGFQDVDIVFQSGLCVSGSGFAAQILQAVMIGGLLVLRRCKNSNKICPGRACQDTIHFSAPFKVSSKYQEEEIYGIENEKQLI